MAWSDGQGGWSMVDGAVSAVERAREMWRPLDEVRADARHLENRQRAALDMAQRLRQGYREIGCAEPSQAELRRLPASAWRLVAEFTGHEVGAETIELTIQMFWVGD